jgi:peptide chain release factor 2
LEKRVRKESLKIFLSKKYDRGDVILQILAGAGGRDAQDWVTMLLRMYERYCLAKGFEARILEQSFGEAGGPEGRIGIKNVTLEIIGSYAFGFLKKEAGVHRLVRISPFSPQKLRHTSFAQVQVLPNLKTPDELDIEIKPEDLKIETFRASGPGGQYMQKTESAVRITHLSSGLQASCQSERSQVQNKKKAMEILRGKLYQLKQQKFQKKVKKLKDKVDPSWGRQIGSYVLHPYKLVKDLRTGAESSNVEAVLDGEIDEFIEKEIKLKT